MISVNIFLYIALIVSCFLTSVLLIYRIYKEKKMTVVPAQQVYLYNIICEDAYGDLEDERYIIVTSEEEAMQYVYGLEFYKENLSGDCRISSEFGYILFMSMSNTHSNSIALVKTNYEVP